MQREMGREGGRRNVAGVGDRKGERGALLGLVLGLLALLDRRLGYLLAGEKQLIAA